MRGPLPGVVGNLTHSVTLKLGEISPYSILNVVNVFVFIGRKQCRELMNKTPQINFNEALIKHCVSKCTAFVLSCENAKG